MAKSTGKKAAVKVKTAVSLSAEAFRKLAIAGAVENKSQSELVEMMISRLLSGYSASVRGAGLCTDSATVTVSGVESHGVNSSVGLQV